VLPLLHPIIPHAKVDRETVSREEVKAAFFELQGTLGEKGG
jgi:hypothetical protein